jgi:hypothetical protein
VAAFLAHRGGKHFGAIKKKSASGLQKLKSRHDSMESRHDSMESRRDSIKSRRDFSFYSPIIDHKWLITGFLRRGAEKVGRDSVP